MKLLNAFSLTIKTNSDLMRIHGTAAPLLHQYDTQNAPQPAFIALDLSEWSAEAEWSGEIGNAVPPAVYHGHVIRFPIDKTLPGKAIADIMESDEFQTLAQRICDGYESIWDGNNYVARLSEDATTAVEDLTELLKPDEYEPSRDIWDFYDWIEEAKSDNADDHGGIETEIYLNGYGVIKATTHDDDLNRIAKLIDEMADSHRCVFTSSPIDTLKQWRDELRAAQ